MTDYNTIPFGHAGGNPYPIPMAPPYTVPVEETMQMDHQLRVPPDEATYRPLLLGQGYTLGLIRSLTMNWNAFARTFWVVDNSGSMQTKDGHRIMEKGKSSSSGGGGGILNFVPCSRWRELVETVDYHANLAAILNAPTTFRLLNNPGPPAGPQIFSIAVRDHHSNHPQDLSNNSSRHNNNNSANAIEQELAVAIHTMEHAQPSGVTPLTEHVLAIRDSILRMLPELQHSGQKLAIILATDGLPSDAGGTSNANAQRLFSDALRTLEGLPVWIVVRLCTDEDDVVEFWNNLDTQLELNLEVLDDFVSEAQEVYTKNPWFTYGLPLHRMREMGFYNRILDLIDEQTLSKDEVRDFLRVLLGNFDAPDPDENWKGFCDVVERLIQQETKVYNPYHKKVMPWIDIKKLRQLHGSNRWLGLF
jgi:hypothetical protein